LLADFRIREVYHYAPVHYLAFIARSGNLLSKEALLKAGFTNRHFRSTSKKQDEERGFARYVHLTLEPHPPILKAKLNSGFPHFEISIPAHFFEQIEYLLCRFNIAKARYFRGAKQEPVACDANGRYFEDMRLPVAVSIAEREALLRHNVGKQMIELLVRDRVPLPKEARFRFFHDNDQEVASDALRRLGAPYVVERDKRLNYKPCREYEAAVREALDKSIADVTWRDTRIEFDRV
jgi:hypothetical protein